MIPRRINSLMVLALAASMNEAIERDPSTSKLPDPYGTSGTKQTFTERRKAEKAKRKRK